MQALRQSLPFVQVHGDYSCCCNNINSSLKKSYFRVIVISLRNQIWPFKEKTYFAFWQKRFSYFAFPLKGAKDCVAANGVQRFSAYSSAVRLFICRRDKALERKGTAFFVDFPRIISDLMKPHPYKTEQPYEIVQTVTLGKIDYDNFCADMLADRQFIEDYSELCSTGPVWKCILVQQRGQKDGILVIPVDKCYVKYAAYYVGVDEAARLEKSSLMDAQVWNAVLAHEGDLFTTTRGLAFSYSVKRNRQGDSVGEIIFDRKEKSVTRATIVLAYRKAIETQSREGYVSGPKKLGVFGASYLYPVFLKLGILTNIKNGNNPSCMGKENEVLLSHIQETEDRVMPRPKGSKNKVKKVGSSNISLEDMIAEASAKVASLEEEVTAVEAVVSEQTTKLKSLKAELKKAAKLFTICVKLVSINKILSNRKD